MIGLYKRKKSPKNKEIIILYSSFVVLDVLCSLYGSTLLIAFVNTTAMSNVKGVPNKGDFSSAVISLVLRTLSEYIL